jgi:hypothetical protein
MLIKLIKLKKLVDVTAVYELNKFLANLVEMTYFGLVGKSGRTEDD